MNSPSLDEWLFVFPAAALLSAFFCVLSLARGFRSFSHQVFALGLLLIGVEQVLHYMSLQVASVAQFKGLQQWRLVVSSVIPGVWAAFSLGYARANYREYLQRSRWLLAGILFVPLLLAAWSFNTLYFYPDLLLIELPTSWVLPLSREGYLLTVLQLLAAVFVLANLERTFRAASGAIRWRIKFLLFGVGLIFAARVYAAGQSLLYTSTLPVSIFAESAAIVAGILLMSVSFFRMARESTQFYVSEELLSNSITFALVGIYLLSIGLSHELLGRFSLGFSSVWSMALVLLAVMGTLLLLSSNQVRHEIRFFLHRHFHRPKYDYRKIWSDFARGTTLIRDDRDLGTLAARMLSDLFAVSSVSIWLRDRPQEPPQLVGSTFLNVENDSHTRSLQQEVSILMMTLENKTMPVDVAEGRAEMNREGRRKLQPNQDGKSIRYCAPLTVNAQTYGMITLNSRFTRDPFDVEDFTLLKIISEQLAAMFFIRRLVEEVEQARQLQAFQTFSAFFVHDLKNLAGSLSLTLQNFPKYYDNPEFREDALQTIGQSVERINSLTERLSFFRDGIQVQRTPADLNRLVQQTVTGLDEPTVRNITLDLSPLPELPLDEDKMQKVLVNLLINAREAAMDGKPEIQVRTFEGQGRAVLEVTDKGRGMSREYLEHSLFQPFKSTKKKGLGIGLYQCKAIVEAHGGKIQVESKEGVGTTFQIHLPRAGQTGDRSTH